MTTIDLISATDTLTFYPTPDFNGWVYDNESLAAWYALPSADPKLSKRPNAHGAYGLGKVFVKEARPILVGQHYAANPTAALAARARLAGFFAEGEAITMRVNDELGSTTRTVWLLDLAAPFRYDFAHFPFDVALVAPDPRRYGATVSDTEGFPSGGTGLQWNLGSLALFFDWGTAGVEGIVQATNTGNASSFPRIEVGAGGAFDSSGFRVTELETGRELTFSRATGTGEVVVLDSRTQRATIASGDVTGALSSRDWFEIPAGATRRYQVNAVGSYTGSPTITLYAASANL